MFNLLKSTCVCFCTSLCLSSRAAGRKSETWRTKGGPVQLDWTNRCRHETANANIANSLQKQTDRERERWTERQREREMFIEG